MELASVTSAAPLTAGDMASTNPTISANGRYVAFQSFASDLVAGLGDMNGAEDVFLRDLATGVTIPISAVPGGGRTGDAASFDPAISDDGRFVTYVSAATNLVKGAAIESDTNVYVYDRDADENGVFDEAAEGATVTRLLSIATDGGSGNLPSGGGFAPFLGSAFNRPVISGNGSSVAFASFASDLALDDDTQTDGNLSIDVYRASTDGGKLTLISVNAEGTGSCSYVFGDPITTNPSISATGEIVAFQSRCDNLVTAASGSVDDTNSTTDVFVGSGGRAALVSINGDGTAAGDGISREPVISGDGKHVAFVSRATDLVRGTMDANLAAEDIFVRDLKNERTTLVSRSRAISTPLTSGNGASPSSSSGGEFSGGPAINDSGRFVVFQSAATDLLDPTLGVADTNGMPDLFVFDRDPDRDGVFDEADATRTSLVSVNSAGTDSPPVPGGPCSSFSPSISGDGRYVAFASTCDDLVAGVDGANVYLRDLMTGTTVLISSTISGGAGGALASSVGRTTSLSGSGDRVAFISDTLATDLDPEVGTDPNGELPDVFVGTPPTDIRLTRNFAAGLTTHTQYFRIAFEPSAPFDIGYYRSPDRLFDPGDAETTLLGTVTVSDPEDLAVDGNRFVSTTIGTLPGEVALPGVGADDLDEDYFILTVGDGPDAIAEFDGDPFNEDNTSALRGLYHLPGGPLFVHGGAGSDVMTATSDGTTLTFTYGTAQFGLQEPFTYDVADVAEVRVRAHEGDDIITGSSLIDVFFGGAGDDVLDGGAGADRLDGGPGNDSIMGGPGGDLIFDGPGDDRVDVGEGDDVIMATPDGRDTFIDTGGSDTLDFSLASLPITIDLDSTATQKVDSAGNTIRLVGTWENLVGTPLDDDSTVYAKPLAVPRRLDGGGGTDRLVFDALGLPVTFNGTTMLVDGFAPITVIGFEQIQTINAAARIIDDGDTGYSAAGFTRQFDPQFPQGFNADIEYSEANSGNTATWIFQDVAPGFYAVSASWTSAPDRASSAPFTIRDGGPNGTIVSQVRINQEVAPGEFADEGVLWSNVDLVRVTGNTLTVELTDVDADATANDAFEFVIADAIRIEPLHSTAKDLPAILDDAPNHPSAGGLTPTIRESTGPSAVAFLPAVIAFQTDIGGPDNGDMPGSQGSGARQVNWDDVADAAATPDFLPGNFFNSTFTRGLQLHTTGEGFQVSGSAASNQGLRFDNLNGTYDAAFATLSPARLFTPVGENEFDVTFFVPGSNTPASVSGFGAVFTDVDTPFTSQMQFFDAAGEQLLSRSILATSGDGSFSFLGVSYDDGAPIARVHITAGDGALLTAGSPDDITQGGVADLVVLDDFIFGEPIALPAPVPNDGFTSDCSAIGGPGFLSDQHTCAVPGQQATWDFSSVPTLPAGTYAVSATWTPGPSQAADARYVIDNGTGQVEVGVNQQLAPVGFTDGGAPWERLAKVQVVAGQPPVVTLSDPQGGTFVADAVRFDPAPTLSVFDALGNPIADGSSIELGQTAIDPVTGLAVLRRRFIIQNTGSASLNIRNVSLGGTGFTLLDAGAPMLPGGGLTEIEVEFTSDQVGVQGGGLATIETNDLPPMLSFNMAVDVVDDTTPPTVEIITPDDGAVFIEGASVPVGVTAVDDVAIKAVDFLIDGNVVGSSSEAPFHFQFTLPSGVSTVEIGASSRDVAGNRTDATPITVNLIEDQPPTVQLVRPYDGDGAIAGSTITVHVDAEDDVAIRQVEFRVDGALQLTQVFAPFVGQVPIPSAAGDHDLEACATDTAGHVTCQTVTVTAFTLPLIDFTSMVVAADAGLPPVVRVFQGGGTEIFRFFAYEPGFLGGVRVATGDVTGDGTPDIITSAGSGGGPHVKVFDGTTGGLLRSFLAFPGFAGGATVAVGDVSGDGVADIITGAGPAVPGGHVKVFDGVDNAQIASFFAFPGSAGGVNVAAGDVNGDGQDDIITGAGAGGGPHVRVFDGHSAGQLPPVGSLPAGALLHDFFPFDPNFTGGVFVAAGDIDNDGIADIVTGPGPGIAGQVKVFSGKGQTELGGFFAFDPSFSGGVRVGAGDVDGDGFADVVTGAGPAGGSRVKVFDGTNLNSAGELDSFFAFDPAFAGGVFVSGAVQSHIDVVNLPPTGGTYEAFVMNNEFVVRQLLGGELFRGPADDHRKVRVNGAPAANDLLITTLPGSSKPLVFDGGVGGFDEVRLAPQTPPTQLEYLKVVFQQVYVTSYSTDRSATPEDFELLTVDLEPIEDQLDVLQRVFTFAADGNQIVLDTGNDPGDTILRLNSQNSEVVDFEQSADSLLLELGPGDDTLGVALDTLPWIDGQGGTNRLNLLGSGLTLDLTAIDDAEFQRIDVIDISGSGANGLVVDAVEVLNLSDTSDTLRVIAGPDDTVLFGSGWVVTGTTIVDGKFFRILEQIVPQLGTARLLLNGPRNWQNPVNHHDVNNDGVAVEPIGDILRLINELNKRTLIDATGRLPVEPNGVNFSFLDVNGDGFLTPAGDVLPQANERNRQLGGGEGELSVIGLPFPGNQLAVQTPLRESFGVLADLPATASDLSDVRHLLRGGQNHLASQRQTPRRGKESAARERLFAMLDGEELRAPQSGWDTVLNTLATAHAYVRVRPASS